MDIEDYNDEINIIKHIAIVNGYNSKIIDKIIHKHANKLKWSDKVKDKTQYVAARYTNILPCLLYTSRCV